MSAVRVAKKVCCPSRYVAALIPSFAAKHLHLQSVSRASPSRSMTKQMQLQLGMVCNWLVY